MDKHVRLETDSLQGDRDRYKRLLRYVYLEDGTFINAKLVQDGYAFAYTAADSDFLDQFRDLERQAREQGKGLWGACDL